MKRKNPVFISAVFAVIIAFALCLAACPDFSDDDDSGSAYYWKPSDSLDPDWSDKKLNDFRWLTILSTIEKRGRKVNLDLSDFELSAGANIMKNVSIDQYGNIDKLPKARERIAFIPDNVNFQTSSAIAGYKLIESIILPDEVGMIPNAVPSPNEYNIEINEETLSTQSPFRYFTRLRSISGKRVQLIGNFSFFNKKSLVEVKFPNAHHINEGAFYGCSSLREANFKEAKNISVRVFEGCTGLRNVDIPTLYKIDAGAFKNCTSLTRVYFPYVGQIDIDAFRGCSNLTEIIFPAATIIGTESFRNCTRLEKAAFHANPVPPSFTSYHPIKNANLRSSVIFHELAFSGCRNLKELDVRHAWNVYFARSALANIGEHLDLYMFDGDDTKCFGHPQQDMFLGGRPDGIRTLKSIRLSLPGVGSDSRVENINQTIGDPSTYDPDLFGIYVYIESTYKNPNIKVEIVRRSPDYITPNPPTPEP